MELWADKEFEMIAMEAKDRDTNLHGKLYTSTEL
jgi:hypothetical protein